MAKTSRTLTDGQRAYEAKRAAKAGMSLEKWLTAKDKAAAETLRAQVALQKAVEAKQKPKGFFGRLIDRAHKPL
jgi:hypothetical protein